MLSTAKPQVHKAVKKEQMTEEALKTPAGESKITVNRASPDSCECHGSCVTLVQCSLV